MFKHFNKGFFRGLAISLFCTLSTVGMVFANIDNVGTSLTSQKQEPLFVIPKLPTLAKLKPVEVKPLLAVATLDLTDFRKFPDATGYGNYLGYKDLLQAVSATTQVDVTLLAQMAAIESSFEHDAVANGNRKGAKGLYQFIDTTWEETVSKHGSRYGITTKVSPFDPKANALMAAEWIKSNRELLETVITDREITGTDIYIVHFLGRSGALRFFSASPDRIAAYTHPKAAKNNYNVFYSKKEGARTHQQLYSYLDNKLKFKLSEFNLM